MSMAEAALGLGGVWVYQHRTTKAGALMRARLEHVLPLLDPASTMATRVRLRLAAEEDYRTGRHDDVLGMLEDAKGDPVAYAEALSLAHHCLLGPEHGQRRRELADQLIGEAARAGRRGDLVMGLMWRTVDQFLAADPHAHRSLAELKGMLAEADHRAVGFVARNIDVMLAIRAGRFDDAEILAKECVELGVEAGDIDAAAWYGAQLVAIRWYQGRLPELLPMLTELLHSPTLSPIDNSYAAALAIAAAQAGDHHSATAALASLRRPHLDDLPRSSTWLVALYGVVEAAHATGNPIAAASAYELLRPYAALPMMASLGVACFGSVHHALGVASLTQGQLDRAVGHFREAVHANLALGHWPAVVLSRQRLADALELRGRAEDAPAVRHQRELAEQLSGSAGLALAPAAEPVSARITRHGRRWRVEVGSRSIDVNQTVGLLHLAVLTANPGTEISAVELVAGVEGLGKAARTSAVSDQPVLDRDAVQSYRRRLAELADAIEDADTPAAADRARAERDWLLAELKAGEGFGGRVRAFTDDGERARIAVGKAIRRTIAQLEETDRMIGRHLRASVHTGVRCWYRPGVS